MRARRILAAAGILLTLLLMGAPTLRLQGLRLRAVRAGSTPLGAAGWGNRGVQTAELSQRAQIAQIARNTPPDGILCLLARGQSADAQNVVRRALGGTGRALTPSLAEGMAGGVQTAAHADSDGVRLYLADPYLPMDY